MELKAIFVFFFFMLYYIFHTVYNKHVLCL